MGALPSALGDAERPVSGSPDRWSGARLGSIWGGPLLSLVRGEAVGLFSARSCHMPPFCFAPSIGVPRRHYRDRNRSFPPAGVFEILRHLLLR